MHVQNLPIMGVYSTTIYDMHCFHGYRTYSTFRHHRPSKMSMKRSHSSDLLLTANYEAISQLTLLGSGGSGEMHLDGINDSLGIVVYRTTRLCTLMRMHLHLHMRWL